MNRLIELVLDTNELYSNFSESESHFLTNISFAIKEKITKELSTENSLVYSIILLNKIWDEYTSSIIWNGLEEETDWDSIIGLYTDPVELDFWTTACIEMEPSAMKSMDESTICFFKLLVSFRNAPSEIVTVLKTFRNTFTLNDSLHEFHTELNKIFDLSGLMFNEDLTRENYYLKTNIYINQIFDQIGFKELFLSKNLNEDKKVGQFVFQNLSANYFLFMNLLFYMNKRTPFLFENTDKVEAFDLKKWQSEFDSWSDSVNSLVDSIAGTPNLNEDQKNDIIARLEEIDFKLLESYCGLYFEIDENNKYEDAKQYLDCLDFLNLFKSTYPRKNTYFEVYHTLQSIYGVEPATAYNWHGGEINYKKPIDVYIWKSNQDKLHDLKDCIIRHRYPLYMINNQYMRENIIVTSKEILTEITYDWKQRLALISPLSVSENNIRNLAFVKELLRHDFYQFMRLPDEIKQNEEIKEIALKQAFNFLSKHVIDDFFTSPEFIKSELGITD
jgi:hypothetical protein